ncbi:MAG TPA: hypothetical protein VIY09_06575, partial [Rhizomicrobium sp.]
MAIEPDFAGFASAWRSGRAQAVFARRVADLETPVSAYLKLAQARDNSFLLESVQGGETRGRYSVIGIDPDLVWRFRHGRAEIARGEARPFIAAETAERPLESLRALVSATQMELPRALPPMAVGLFGYLGYDMVRCIEELGPTPHDTLDLPDAIVLRPTI